MAECRKNDRNEKRALGAKEAKAFKQELIYNYYPIQLSQSFMSVYIFNKEKEKDLYRVIAVSKKKKTLTVYEKFNADQIHNETHIEEHQTDLNTPLNISIPLEETKHDEALQQNTQQGFSKENSPLEGNPKMAYGGSDDSEPAFLPVKIGGLAKRRVDRVKSKLVQKPL